LATSPFFPAPTATSGAAETKATARRDASTTGIGSISAAQRRLSEITEMIHTASLLHDDVIDEADTRRGVPSVNQMFGNKLAILGGDFLLARASVALARLRNPDVVELLSTVVEHLVKGEVMQMRNARGDAFSNVDLYLTKSFYKTASLMANSCRAAAMLAGLDSRTCDVSFEYGKHLGLTFQLVDDLLDFVGTDGSLGKPAQHDLAQGVVTLPVLYAAQEFPELNTLIGRGFKSMGDVERGLELVRRSSAIDKARETAWSCAEGAVAAAMQLPASHARAALISLVDKVLTRDR
jgi:geranylgeranyl pyrophosphate synthase